MTAVVGRVLYLATTIAAILAIAFAGYITIFGARRDSLSIDALLVSFAVSTWILGWACRYLLTRR
jgi:hypothetical protein